MASFELTSTSCDGHLRALSKAISIASRISKDGLLEFTTEKVRLCAKTDLYLVKFVFNKDFFTDYKCDRKHKCYINLKVLLMPFKSNILVNDRDGNLRSQIKIKCSVEDQVNNQIIFTIGSDTPSTTLTYRLNINDLDADRMDDLNAINRTIDYAIVEIAPLQLKKDRFLLSGFNSFAPDIDQVTIKTTPSEVKFIGSSSPLLSTTNTTSEFTHIKEDFSTFQVKEDLNITIPLRFLKLFLNFVETNKVQTCPKYIFEGKGLPAHFIYGAQLFRAHYVSATPFEYIPLEIADEEIRPIGYNAPNESFLGEDNYMEPYIDIEEFDAANIHEEEEDEEEDGYNDDESECSEHLDGNLEGLDTSIRNLAVQANNTSVFGAESIRSELVGYTYEREKVEEVCAVEEDVDDIIEVGIDYSSGEE